MLNIEDFFKERTVDEDFDEVFYQNQYPETKEFYQPWCRDNNISDRQRLFYHYANYGLKLYKNLEEYNKSKLVSKLSPRKKVNNKLAVVTCLYNPCDYVNLYRNYEIFHDHITKHADLYTIELSFDGKFYSDFFCSEAIKLKGNRDNVLWQKEKLLNILIQKLPRKYTDIAWIDCDIIFEDPYWVYSVFDYLSKYKVVHLFDSGYKIDDKGNKSTGFSSIVKDLTYGFPGYAWAARREVINQVGLLDNQILGGADFVMSSSFMGKPNLLERLSYFIDNEYTRKWIDKTQKLVDSSVYFLNQSVTHLYHGSFEKRNYVNRYNDFLNNFSFDEEVELDSNNLWKLKNDIKSNKVFDYFMSREEDDNILDLNSYFDKIYVLNLDRHQDRMKDMVKKLNQLNIDFERFVGIDGDSLDFENPNFLEGSGDIENRYTLACLLSHMNIVKEAKEKNYKRILIFEDDVLFCDYFKVRIQKLKNIPDDWKLLYLGGSQYEWKDVEHKECFYFSKKTLGTFAYAVDSSIYEEILTFSDQKAIDFNLYGLQEKYYKSCYTFYPNVCIANVEESLIRSPRNQSEHNQKMRWNIYDYT